MVRLVVLAIAAVLFGPAGGSSAQDPATKSLLEPDVQLGHGIGEIETAKAAELIRAAVEMVRASGYRCDSVSYVGLRALFWSGIALDCNRYRYSYRIEDVGGNWIVTVK